VGWCSARGTCNGGADAGQSCDHNPDCASGSCSANTNLTETTMVLKRNTVRFSKGGFGSSPYKCSDHLSGACATATANCSHSPGTGQATVARCCDPASNTWTFQTYSFSEFFVRPDCRGSRP
jgi:hypothetical protein